MRKRTQKHLFDNIMWYLLYLLPVIGFLCLLCQNSDGLTLSSAMSIMGFDVFLDSPIYTALDSLFGADGVLHLFVNTDLIAYATYFVSIYLVHLAIDVLLFIPRFAHKCMDCFGGDK